jgi:hypothetical protein
MAKQIINIGTTANDGTGDAIRAAFGKVNDNFTEIYTANTGVNTGDQNLSAYATTAAVAAGYQPLDSDLTAISALTTTAYGRALLSTADAATLRSAIGVGQTDAPTFLAQTLTGQSLTGTQATSLVDLAATWNTSGTPTAIKLNVIETGVGSNAASNLMDLQVGGVSKFKVDKNGRIYNSGPGIAYNSGVGWWIGTSSMVVGLGDRGITLGGQADLYITRDDAGILAQRNGTNAQAFRVANSVGASPLVDYDRGVFDFKTTTNTLRIGTENGGTYTTARPIDFVTGGVVRMSIAAAGNVGIGTATPRVKLHLEDTVAPFSIEVSGSTIPSYSSVGFSPSIGSNTNARISSINAGWGGISHSAFSTTTTVVPVFNFEAHHGSTSPTTPAFAFISYKHNGSTGRTALAASEITYQISNAATQLMTVLGSGNIGIGTNAPASKLQVTGGDVEVATIASGLILKSPDGTRYRVTVPNGGTALTITAV